MPTSAGKDHKKTDQSYIKIIIVKNKNVIKIVKFHRRDQNKINKSTSFINFHEYDIWNVIGYWAS